MELGKRGISGTITIILLIMCVVVLFVIVYTIVNYFMKEAEQNTKIKITTSDLELEKSLLILEKDSGKLQLNIKGDTQLQNISLIKAVVLGSSGSGSYLIYDIPKKGVPKNYVLNVSMVGNIREILIYPVVYTPTGARSQSNVLSKAGEENINQIVISPSYGKERVEYFISSLDISISTLEIDPDTPVINPEQIAESGKMGCISDWECEEWTTCHAIYTLDNAIENEFNLSGEQTRLCKDNNNCLSYLVDRRECVEKAYVTIKSSVVGNKQYVEIYDEKSNLVSKLEFIKGEHSVLNIDIPII